MSHETLQISSTDACEGINNIQSSKMRIGISNSMKRVSDKQMALM